MRQIKINSTTGSEIVNTADLKLFAKIDTTADDAIIARMITQAEYGVKTIFQGILLLKTDLII